MDPFLLKLLLSFLVGGVWITLTTIAAETFGSRVGGVLGGLPSTIVVAMASIAWTQGAGRVYEATTALPAAFAVNCLFLLTYAVLVQRGLDLGLAGALLVWFALQSALVASGLSSYPLALAIWAVTLVSVYLVMDRVLRLRAHPPVAVRRTRGQVLGRGLLSGLIIVLAVLGSRFGGPTVGAALAAFPAVYVSTLLITSRSVSVAFSRSLLVPLMVSAVVNCVVFGGVLRAALPAQGPVVAIACAYVAALGSAALTYAFLRRRAA